MGNDDSNTSASGADLAKKFADLASEAVFQMLRNVQRANTAGDVTAPLGLGVDKLQSWLGRGSNIAFESTVLGLNTWKQLLELSRRFEPEVLAGQMAPHAVWVDPAARLESESGIVELTRQDIEFEDAAGKKESRYRYHSASIEVANRSKHTVQLNLPKVLELRRARDGAVWVAELNFDASDPVLLPGDTIELRMMTNLANSLPERDVVDAGDIWFGALAIRTRGPLHVQVMVSVVFSGKKAAKPSPSPAPATTGETVEHGGGDAVTEVADRPERREGAGTGGE